MKVLGLDGKTYSWQFTHTNVPRTERSSYFLQARELLQKLYPSDRLWEEVPLPGTKPTLYADFVLPQRKLLVEVHGEQHYTYNSFFHGSKKNFMLAQRNDKNKARWAELNSLQYIELPFNESINNWIERIINRGDLE